MMNITTLEHIDTGELADTFNLAFSDYFVPVQLTVEQLNAKMKADNTDLSYSVGAFDNGRLVAFILHGLDTVAHAKAVYNGGTGVIPDKRGQGLTKRMYEFMLPLLKEKEADYLVLEVISDNIPAIRSYEKVGYKTVRVLKCYRGRPSPKNADRDIIIKELDGYDWPSMSSFWDFTPTWQHSPRAMEGSKTVNRSAGAYIDGKLAGYVIYSPSGRRIQHIAVDREHRRKGIASALVAYILDGTEDVISVVNVDENSLPANNFLSAIGLTNYLDQLEMKMEL